MVVIRIDLTVRNDIVLIYEKIILAMIAFLSRLTIVVSVLLSNKVRKYMKFKDIHF